MARRKEHKTTKLEYGSVYQKSGSNGVYYYRYQVNDQRKAVSLKTKNYDEAITKAKELIPIIKSQNLEILAAHVKHARGLGSKLKLLPLYDAWQVYSKKPDRATPATVSEQNAYRSTFEEFIRFIQTPSIGINEITPEIAEDYAQYLRGQQLAVDTHNRKIRRMKKIFDVLHEYRDSDNPFIAPSLKRKEREEQENNIRRLSFTKAEEAKLLKVLDDSKFKVKNKPEIRVIYHIGMFTGQRFKDCIMLRWDQVNFTRNIIRVKQFKTGKEVTIPIASKLLETLHEAKKWQTNHYVCPNVAARYNTLDKTGKNVGNNLVNIDALRVIKWIGLEPSVQVPGRKKKVTVYGFHSLRHSFVSHCAEAGVPKAVVLSIIGTNSDIVDKHYTHIGDDAQQRAIEQLFGDKNNISDRERIVTALTIIDKLKEKNNVIIEIEKALRQNSYNRNYYNL